MKNLFYILLLFLPSIVFSQNNFIKQITFGDFDARNPFIYNNGYGNQGNPVFFELHNSGASNIYYKTYDESNNRFEDTVALTHNNYLNINPSFHPSIGVLFQTNQNSNWDIAFIPYENNNWGETTFLTTSQNNEIKPRLFNNKEDYYPPNVDSLNILFSRDGNIIHLNYKNNQAAEVEVFQSNNNFTYNEFAGLQDYFSGYTVFAIEEDVSGIKRIVRRIKPYNGNYEVKEILRDSCDCSDMDLAYTDFINWMLFYTDTLLGERRYFALSNPQAHNPSLLSLDILYNGNLSSLGLYLMLIITKNEDVTMFEPNWAYTYLLERNDTSYVRLDVSDLAFGVDSLHPLKVSASSLAIGALGTEYNQILVYTVWEDSVDGHLQLFGAPVHIQYSSVKEEISNNNFVLYQNYPNPFNPSTKIEYKLLKASDVKFKVYNFLGEKVIEQNLGYQTAGNYKLDFDGRELSSGIYIYSISADESRLSRKMMLVK